VVSPGNVSAILYGIELESTQPNAAPPIRASRQLLGTALVSNNQLGDFPSVIGKSAAQESANSVSQAETAGRLCNDRGA